MFVEEAEAVYIVSVMTLSIILFIVGLALLLYFSEKLVEGTVATSLTFGVSAFMISVVFIGFDPENLMLGSVATWESAFGIALGTIFGAAMVAIALALGITALIAPMEFDEAPLEVLAVPVISVLLISALSVDGLLSRPDGFILLTAFVLSIFWLIIQSGKGVDIKAGGEVAEVLEKKEPMPKFKAIGLLVISLLAIIAGSEFVVRSSKDLIGALGLTETVFGMTILALLVSIEELARELPAALKGRPDITYGNVAGSILAFFLFNAGIMALIQPLQVETGTLQFHIPICILTVLYISFCMYRKKLDRSSGIILVIAYIIFFAGSYFI